MSFTDSDSEWQPERSKDSLAVHKARLQRGKQQQHDEEEDEDLEPEVPETELEVQARIDSIALAQKRMKPTGKPSALSHNSSSDSEPSPTKSKIKAARTRFATDIKPAAEEPEEKKSTLGGAMSSMGRKLAGVFGAKKKEEPAPAPVEISAESTHVKFSDGVEVVPTAVAAHSH